MLIPYTERHHNYPEGRPYKIDFEVVADDWIEALNLALQRFSQFGAMDYHSWHCEPGHSGLEVIDLESGRRFHITDEKELPASIEFTDPPAEDAEMPYPELMRILRREDPPATAASNILDLVLEASQSDAGSILIIGADGQEVSFFEARGTAADDVKGYKLVLGQGIAGWCALRGETFAIADAQAHPRFFKKISDEIGYETRSILCCPAWTTDQAVGVLELLNRKGEPRYRRHEVEFAEACARIIALLLSSDPAWQKRPSPTELRARTSAGSSSGD